MPKRKSGAKILSTSRDPLLLEARKLLLEAEIPGAKVVSAANHLDVLEACREHKFDVVLIGYTIPDAEKVRLEKTVRETCPSAHLLELVLETPPATDAHAAFDVAKGSAAFVRAVKQLLATISRTAPKKAKRLAAS